MFGPIFQIRHWNNRNKIMKINSPPKLAEWILSHFVYKGENAEKLGDLEEGFWMKAEYDGILQAKLWYWWMVILVIRTLNI